MAKKTYPRWIDETDEVLLREVAPGLFVGGRKAVRMQPWVAVVDLYGSSGDVENASYYAVEDRVGTLLRWPFDDGLSIPPGLLDAVANLVAAHAGNGSVLIHCQAGLSRSASIAYAMLRTLGGLDRRQALARIHVENGFPRKQTLTTAEDWAKSRLRHGVRPNEVLRA